MAELFSTNNKFGIWYVITRLALAILIIIQLVLLIVGLINCHGCSVGAIIWVVFCFLILLLGLLAAWKEHFLTALIFAIIEIVLAITGFMYASAYSAVGVVLCVICAIIFSIMLWMSGSRDLGPPQVC